MRRFITFTLSVILAIAVVVPAETTEEYFTRIQKRSAETVRINPDDPQWEPATQLMHRQFLLDELTRCGSERISLRRAAMCEHTWKHIGPGKKGCPKCASIAHFVGGEWQVVFCDGIWVGPEPRDYPNEYNLRPLHSHKWVESQKGIKFCERCGVYAIQHTNGDWLLIPRGSKWVGGEPK